MNASHDTQVHDVERIDTEVAQIVMHRTRQFGRALRRDPRRIGSSDRADLCHDDEALRIGIQRLSDELVGDVRTVEVARVDVIDSGCGAQKLVMRQRGKCGVTLQAQVRRRSLGMRAEGRALLRRMERLGPTSGAVASDCNR
jgi:hypothetical protein